MSRLSVTRPPQRHGIVPGCGGVKQTIASATRRTCRTIVSEFALLRAAVLVRGELHTPTTLGAVLKLVLPKGSLEKATMELFAAADLSVQRSSAVDYSASIDDPRIDSVRILRPQEIPTYVADGLFDLGITGRDWVEETGSDVVSLGELRYSKATSKPIKVVLAVPEDSPYRSADGPAGRREGLHRVHGHHPPLLRVTRRRRRHPSVLRGDRGEGARHRRLHRRDHRDRARPAGRRAPDHRRGPDLLHRAGGQPRRVRRSRQAPRHGTGHDACCWA